MTYGNTGYGTYPTYGYSEYSSYAQELADQAYADGWDDLMWGDVDPYLYRWDDDYADGVDDADYHLYKKHKVYSYPY